MLMLREINSSGTQSHCKALTLKRNILSTQEQQVCAILFTH
jgi:hypothetical protein